MSEFGEAATRLSGLAAKWLLWRPGEFWAATPAELESALGGGETAGGAAPTRGELDALLALHPDKDNLNG